MLNYIWFLLIIFGIIAGIIFGRGDQVTNSVVYSSKEAINLCINLAGIICLWSGLMKIAEKSGLVKKISIVIRPLARILFPKIPDKHPAISAILLNYTANFLGLGNAATPFGLKAMKELQTLNSKKDTATDEMSMFIVLNTSAIQLIPATIIAVRMSAGAFNPADITVTVWTASICATIIGVLSVKILSAIWKDNKK